MAYEEDAAAAPAFPPGTDIGVVALPSVTMGGLETARWLGVRREDLRVVPMWGLPEAVQRWGLYRSSTRGEVREWVEYSVEGDAISVQCDSGPDCLTHGDYYAGT